MYYSVSKRIGQLAEVTALLGGIGLFAVIAITCVSVAGRALDGLGLGPVPGDIELVELGIGFAVFSTLPYAQFFRAHARVDLFKPAFGARPNRVLDLIGELLMCALTLGLSWRLWLGMLDKAAYHETTFILQIPLVWGYRAAMAVMIVACIVALFCVLRAARELMVPDTSAEAQS
ncbi:TRAP transporter small permease [Celeribacter sp. PS-C1]|uniref:TRAP transporter small permease n=1 Tax=Celeribacter sp. PS-C1 TaxID=2820813 RepID=UPI001C671D3D|nr:TRAP transporter small permease [Celeribacter sp. PS-C1]MBW6417275.1 TRAP transporter small permease [Celeribacter sp. PS-C1]